MVARIILAVLAAVGVVVVAQTSLPRPGGSPSVVSSFLRWGGGAFYANNCIKLDSQGQAVDAGAPCSLPAGNVQFYAGTRVNGNCAKFDASGNIVDAGAPCGSGSVGSPPTWNMVDFEVPAGVVNGTTNSFTLANTPNPANSLKVYRNGLLYRGGGVDFTLSGNVINFVVGAIPQTGDQFFVEYRY